MKKKISERQTINYIYTEERSFVGQSIFLEISSLGRAFRIRMAI